MKKSGIIILFCVTICVLIGCNQDNEKKVIKESYNVAAPVSPTPAISPDAMNLTEAEEASAPSWSFLTPSNYYGSDAYTVVDGMIYSFAVTNGNNVKMEVYDPAKDIWSIKSSPSKKRFMYSVVSLKGKIYLLGGATDNNLTTTNAVEEYDPASGEWTEKAPMNKARLGSTFALTIRDKIYCVGQGIIEEYDPSTDIWSISYSGLMERDGYGIAVLNNKLYIIGGKSKDAARALSDVEEYDPETDALIKKADLAFPVCFPSLRVYDNKIYLLLGTDEGGVNGIDTVQSYDPDMDIWELKSQIPFPRADVQVAEAGGKFYTIGGWYNNTFTADVEIYDQDIDEWTIGASLPDIRNYFCAVGLDNKIYVFGGKIDYNTAVNTALVMKD